MHDERSSSELQEIQNIHERYLQDYSTYMERFMRARQSRRGEHAGAGAHHASVPTLWSVMAAAVISVFFVRDANRA